MARIPPLDPLPEETMVRLQAMMPPNVQPLALFRTIARNPRILQKLYASNMLDRGTLSLRQREIIINRITAKSGAAYEWGVHIAFFGDKVGFTKEQIRSLAIGESTDACWNSTDSLLIRMCDQLQESSTISDEILAILQRTYDDPWIIEATAVAGYYKMISFLVNVIGLDKEPFGSAWPEPLSS